MRLFILLLCLLKDGSFHYTPTCHYQDSQSRRMCDIFTQIDCAEISNASKIKPVDPDSLSWGSDDYVNSTFSLAHTKRIVLGFVEISNGTDMCFEFNLNSTDMLLHDSIILWLDFLPLGDSPKIYGDDLMKCAAYERGSRYTLQSYSTTELRFVFTPIPGIKQVEATLLSGSCEISCRDINKCNVTTNRTMISNFTKPVFFTNLHPGHYYCIRISHNGCSVHTKTEYLKNVTDIVVKIPSNRYVVPIVAALSIAVGILALFVLRTLYYQGSSLHQPVPPDDSPVNWRLIREIWKKNSHTEKLLLLYSRDSPAFSEAMKAFHRLVQNFSYIEVLDLFQWEETEEASRNITGWLTKHIVNSDVKLVIVVSEGAMIRQKALLNNMKLEFSNPHFLDPVFTQALQLLHDPKLCNDYNRIFPIRFDDFTCNTIRLSLIVPLRCYDLLRDLGKLIQELKSTPDEPNLEDMRNQCPDEVDTLETTIRNATVFYKENANYFSNWYSAVK